MTAPISVIIPTLNAADQIGACLGALGEALFEGLLHEVILADGGSTDQIADVAEAVGARLIQAPPGRGHQLAAGVREAKGAWLLVIHADSVIGPGWIDAVRAHMQGYPGDAGYFRLSFASDHPMARFVAGWANVRSRVFGLPYGDQGLLIPRILYDRVGGYDEIPLMEDVALARRLRGHLRALPIQIVTDASRYERDGWFRRGRRNLTTLMRYLCGAKPDVLARDYNRK